MSHCCEQDEGVEQIWRHVLLLMRVEANTRQALARAKTIRWGSPSPVAERERSGLVYCRNNAGDSKLHIVVRAVALCRCRQQPCATLRMTARRPPSAAI